MFNTDNRYSEDYRRQEDDESDNEQEATPYGNLDSEVRKIAAALGRAAFDSCISDIEVEGDTLFKNIFEQVRGIVRKPWFREAGIIAAVLIFKTGLFLVYREARNANLDIVNL